MQLNVEISDLPWPGFHPSIVNGLQFLFLWFGCRYHPSRFRLVDTGYFQDVMSLAPRGGFDLRNPGSFPDVQCTKFPFFSCRFCALWPFWWWWKRDPWKRVKWRPTRGQRLTKRPRSITWLVYNYEHMGVSKNRGTPKWMVYNGKPYKNGWFGGTTI